MKKIFWWFLSLGAPLLSGAFLIPLKCLLRTNGFATNQANARSSSIEHVFTDEVSERLAARVCELVELPFVPSPVVTYVLMQIFDRLSQDLAPNTLESLQEVLEAEGTDSGFDDVEEAELNVLANQIAFELNEKIDVPMLDETQELQVLEEVIMVVLKILTTDEKERGQLLLMTEMEMSRDLLSSPESRKKLVNAINAAVDVPILNEDQEEELIVMAVDSISELMTTLLPPEFAELLKGEPPEGIASMKDYIVAQVCERVDLFGLSKKQEKILIETMVNVLIDKYIDGTDEYLVLLSPREQEEVLLEKKAFLERKKLLSQRRCERERLNLSRKLDRLEQSLQQLRSSRAPS